MRVVGGFDDAVKGWIQRLAQTSAPHKWNFTSEALSWFIITFLSSFTAPSKTEFTACY